MDRATKGRQERALQRSNWVGKKYVLGQEPPDNLSPNTTPAQRLGMMWELASQAWLLTGQGLPDYERANMPGQVVRREARHREERQRS